MLRLSNRISKVIEQSNTLKHGVLNNEVTTLTPQVLPKSQLKPLIDKANSELKSGHISAHPQDYYDRSIGVGRAWSERKKKLQIYFFVPIVQ